MTARIATQEYRNLRISVFVPVMLPLVVACQFGGAAKLPVTPNAESNLPPANGSAQLTTSAELPPAPVVKKFSKADFDQHITKLRARIRKTLPATSRGRPGRSTAEFSIVVQPPFVVIGDESKQALQQHADGTVKWALERLKYDFFVIDPTVILDIWLFRMPPLIKSILVFFWRDSGYAIRVLLQSSPGLDHEH